MNAARCSGSQNEKMSISFGLRTFVASQWKLRSLFLAMALCAGLLVIALRPYKLEASAIDEFGGSGSLTRSWVILARPTLLESVLQFPGAVNQVCLNSEDDNLAGQRQVGRQSHGKLGTA